MRRILFVLSMIIGGTAHAQRTMEVITDDLFATPFPSDFKSARLNNAVIIETAFGRLHKVTDFSSTSYPYPPGYSYHPSHEIVTYNSAVYIVFSTSGGYVLYNFDGTNYHTTSVPGEIQSSPVVFGGFLYILADFGGLVQLYRYDGTTATAVPSTTLTRHNDAFYDLRVSGNHLYLSGFMATHSGIPGFSVMKRYDGASVSTLPSFAFFNGISQVEEVATTGEVYFIADRDPVDGRRHIFYFNGLIVTDIYAGALRSPVQGVIFQNNLFFLDLGSSDGFSHTAPLRKAIGTVIISIPMPTGSQIYATTRLVVFRDAIHFPTSAGGEYRLLSYDGFFFSTAFSRPGGFEQHGPVFLRDAKLLIQPTSRTTTLYEFDGSSSITITAPTGYQAPYYLGATPCNYLWGATHTDHFGFGSLLKEAVCISIPFTPVIPRYFERFSLFTAAFSASTRSKTWSFISGGWQMSDKCQEPNCSAPTFLLTLTDAQQKIAWQEKFDKPFVTTVPVDDTTALKTTWSAVEQGLKDIIVLDDDLIEKGITRIGLSFYSNNQNFLLAATTRNGMTVPLKLSLLSKDGKVIWENQYMAPIVTTITDKVTQPGEVLRFSIASNNPNNPIEVTDAISFTCTNPSHGLLNIDMKDKEKMEPALLSIYSIVGQKLFTKRIANASDFRIELPEYRPGLFVISIKTRTGKVGNKVVMLK